MVHFLYNSTNIPVYTYKEWWCHNNLVASKLIPQYRERNVKRHNTRTATHHVTLPPTFRQIWDSKYPFLFLFWLASFVRQSWHNWEKIWTVWTGEKMNSLRIRQAMFMIASFYYNYTIIHFPGSVFGKLMEKSHLLQGLLQRATWRSRKT